MKELEGLITISRPNCNNGREYISIQIQDKNSRLQFLEVELDYSNFTKILTGLANADCKLITRGLENVGKIKEQKTVTFEIPEKYKYATGEIISKIAKKHIPEGWYSSLFFGSKRSTYTDDKNKLCARMTVYRFVEKGI